MRATPGAYIEVPVEKMKKRAADLASRHGIENPLRDYRTTDLQAMTSEERAALFEHLPPEYNPSIRLRSANIPAADIHVAEIAVAGAAKSLGGLSTQFEGIAHQLAQHLRSERATAFLREVMTALKRYCDDNGLDPSDFDIRGIAADLSSRQTELLALSAEEREANLDALFEKNRKA